jgi:hypothetical protein
MKPTIIAILFLLIVSYAFSQDNKCEEKPALVDSMYYMKWDSLNSNWVIESIRHYKYNNENLEYLLLLDGASRDSVWIWSYYYNLENNRDYEVLRKWNKGTSDLSQKKESTFNFDNKKTSELLSNWKNGLWLTNTNSIFEYSDGKLVRAITQINDKNGVLYNNLYTNYIYQNDKLQTITTERVSDGLITKYSQYSYNDNGNLNNIVYYQIVPSSNTSNPQYVPVSKRTYSYDVFSNNNEVLFENWINGAWALNGNYIYYRKIDFAKKVSVCHNGKTLCVAKSALPAFLKQGSTLGACPVNNRKLIETNPVSTLQESQNISFSVYPNPAINSVTIDGLRSSTNRIEIYNSVGILVKVIEKGDKNSVTINRNGLPSGNYLIHVIDASGNQTRMLTFR